MATPLARRPDPDGDSPMAVPAGTAAAEYLLPATRRGIAAQTTAALILLTGLWVALSPLFLTLQHGGANPNAANLIAGLVAAAGAFALASPRGFPGLQVAGLVLGVWVIISSFILDAKFSSAAPMYWSNSWSGGVLVVLALAGLAALRPATRRSHTCGPWPRRQGPHSATGAIRNVQIPGQANGPGGHLARRCAHA